MRLWVISLWFGLLTLSSASDAKPPRPLFIHELGFSYTQTAYIYPTAEVVWLDRELMIEDFPFLARYSESELKALLVRNFAVLTSLQQKWNGILMNVHGQPLEKRRTISHPNGYIRGGVGYFMNRQGNADFGQGLVDFKGSGFSIQGEQRLAVYIDMFKVVSGEMPEVLSVDESAIASAQSNVEKFDGGLKRLREMAQGNLSPEQRQANQLRYRSYSDQRAVWEAFRKGLIAYHAKGPERDAALAAARVELIEAFRASDYVNGLFAVDRGLKEIIVERAAQKLFTGHNEAFQTNYSTVRNYFLVALPVDILGPNGKVLQAGVLGRRAHWRASGETVERHNPLPPHIVKPVIAGNFQFSVDGGLVDFEVPEIVDPRVSDVLGFSIVGQRVEKLTQEAIGKFRAGEKNAPTELVNSIVGRLNDAPTVAIPVEPTTRTVSKTFQRLYDVFRRQLVPGAAQLNEEGILAAFDRFETEGGDIEQLSALYSVLATANQSLAAKALIARLTKIAKEPLPPKDTNEGEDDDEEESLREKDPRLIALTDALYAISSEGLSLRGDEHPHYAVMQHFHKVLPDSYLKFVRKAGPELYRNHSILDGDDIVGEGFIPRTMLYETFSGVIAAYVHIIHQQIPAKDLHRVQMIMGTNPVPFTEIVTHIGDSSIQIFGALAEVAERLSGKKIPDDILLAIDPVVGKQHIELRTLVAETTARLLQSGQMTAEGCGPDVAAAAVEMMRTEAKRRGLKLDE